MSLAIRMARRVSRADIGDLIDGVTVSRTAIQVQLSEAVEAEAGGRTLTFPWTLQKLLADVQARRIDVIVVYKVDRLTRSLADFAKLVELICSAT
jgi:hypothetical protein